MYAIFEESSIYIYIIGLTGSLFLRTIFANFREPFNYLRRYKRSKKYMILLNCFSILISLLDIRIRTDSHNNISDCDIHSRFFMALNFLSWQQCLPSLFPEKPIRAVDFRILFVFW